MKLINFVKKLFVTNKTEEQINIFPEVPTWGCKHNINSGIFKSSIDTYNICQNWDCPHVVVTRFEDGAEFMTCGSFKSPRKHMFNWRK